MAAGAVAAGVAGVSVCNCSVVTEPGVAPAGAAPSSPSFFAFGFTRVTVRLKVYGSPLFSPSDWMTDSSGFDIQPEADSTSM